MSQSATSRSVRAVAAVLAVAASALGAGCSNPVAPREVAAAPRTSVVTTEAKSTALKSDTAVVTPVADGAYSGGGSWPWY